MDTVCYFKGPKELCLGFLLFDPKSGLIVVMENTNNTNNKDKMFLLISPPGVYLLENISITRIISIVLDVIKQGTSNLPYHLIAGVLV